MTLIGNFDGAIKAEAAHRLRRGDMNLADVIDDMLHTPGKLDNWEIAEAAAAHARQWDGLRRARLTGFLSHLVGEIAAIDLEDDAAARGAY